jgi:PAS domain S-box-containing protein
MINSTPEKPTYEELEKRVLELEKNELAFLNIENDIHKIIQRSNIILESINDAIFSLNEDLIVTYFNHAAEQMLGKKRQEVLGHYLFDVFSEARGSIFDEKYHLAVKEQIPLFFETYFDVAPYRNWYEVRVYPHSNGISVIFQIITERKLVEEKIAYLAKFPSENPNPVLRLRWDGLILYANEASNIIIQDWRCQVGDCCPQSWSHLINEAITNQTCKQKEVVINDRIFVIDVTPIPNTGYANLYGRDVTDRKIADEALRKSEMRFRSMFENHKAIMLLIDPVSGKIVDANQAAQQFYGYSLNALKEKAIQEINLLTQGEISVLLDKAVRTQKHHFVFPHRLASGETRIVEVFSSPIDIGDSQVLFSIIHDITDRKRAELALADSERRLADIIDFLPYPTWVIDVDHRVIAWNRAMEQMTGIQKRDIIGKGDLVYSIPFYGWPRPMLIDLVLNRDSQWEKGYLTLREENGILILSESFHPSMGEGGRYIAGTASRLYNSQGDIVGAIESIRDITVTKRLEQGREKLIAELQEALSKVRTLTGLLPICASCKKIRDDQGYWNQLESYIIKNSDAKFTHGICPECVKKLYPDIKLSKTI